MKNSMRPSPAILFTALAFIFASSCTQEEDLAGNAQIEVAFRLKSLSAMDGKILIHEAFLKLDRLHVAGTLPGDHLTDVTHAIPPGEPPYKLSMADSNHVSFNLTSKAYQALDFHLFLLQDAYQLVITTTQETPPPDDENGSGTDGDDEGQGEDSDGDDSEDESDGNDGDSDDDSQDDGNTGGAGDGGEDGSGTDDGDDNDGDDDDGDDGEDGDDDDGEDGDDDDKDKGKGKGKNEDKKDDDKNKGKNDDDRRTSGEIRTVDLDHFFQNAKPAMVVFGLYQNNGVTVNIIFVVSGIEKFTVNGKQNDSFNISLDTRNEAVLTFDPQRWFETITQADIESAIIQEYQQQKVLLIHKDFNTELFEALAPRIEGSTDLTINKADATSF